VLLGIFGNNLGRWWEYIENNEKTKIPSPLPLSNRKQLDW
jgi:hypothetical protein